MISNEPYPGDATPRAVVFGGPVRPPDPDPPTPTDDGTDDDDGLDDLLVLEDFDDTTGATTPHDD